MQRQLENFCAETEKYMMYSSLKKGSLVKINGNAIKPGNVIEHNGKLWTAVKVSHVKPGKGSLCSNRASECEGWYKTE